MARTASSPIGRMQCFESMASIRNADFRAESESGANPPRRSRRRQENSDKVFREKVDCEFEYRLVLPSGIVRHIHALARPVLNGEGELIEVVGTDIDVTERKRAEAALRRGIQAYLAEAQRLSHTGSLRLRS